MSQEIIETLVKRHSHDLRNFLNGIEMDLTLLGETISEEERRTLISRMRREMKSAEAIIRSFTAKFTREQKTSIPVADLAEQWMADTRNLLPESSIAWDVKAGNAIIEVEPGFLRSALSDLTILLARKYSRLPLDAICHLMEEKVVFSISCPQAASEKYHSDSFSQSLWASFQGFAARNNCVLEEPEPGDRGGVSYRLIFPISPAQPISAG